MADAKIASDTDQGQTTSTKEAATLLQTASCHLDSVVMMLEFFGRNDEFGADGTRALHGVEQIVRLSKEAIDHATQVLEHAR